jgi:hypothetical protein
VPSSSCNNGGGQNRAGFAVRDGGLFLTGEGNGMRTYDAVNGCQNLINASNISGAVDRLAGAVNNDGGVELYFGDENGNLYFFNGGSGLQSKNVANAAFYGVDAYSDQGVRVIFAVGRVGGNLDIERFDDNSLTWSQESISNPPTQFLASVSIVNSTTAFAAGGNEFWRWDGGSWGSVGVAPPFYVFGIKAFGPNLVYAVGGGYRAVAYFDGSGWVDAGTYSANMFEGFGEIRGPDACHLWVVGPAGGVYRSAP